MLLFDFLLSGLLPLCLSGLRDLGRKALKLMMENLLESLPLTLASPPPVAPSTAPGPLFSESVGDVTAPSERRLGFLCGRLSWLLATRLALVAARRTSFTFLLKGRLVRTTVGCTTWLVAPSAVPLAVAPLAVVPLAVVPLEVAPPGVAVTEYCSAPEFLCWMVRFLSLTVSGVFPNTFTMAT